MYITRGDSFSTWLCTAVCSMPPAWSALITGPISSSVSTRSPIAIACPFPVCLNAAQEPSASAGLIATPLAVTERSLRGKLNFSTSPGWAAPFRPSASSTPGNAGAAWPMPDDGAIAMKVADTSVLKIVRALNMRCLGVMKRTRSGRACLIRL